MLLASKLLNHADDFWQLDHLNVVIQGDSVLGTVFLKKKKK